MEEAQPIPGSMMLAALRLLADGEFHSGTVLAQQLGVSRSSINNALQDAAGYGLMLQSIRGRGYRLTNPPQWLDAQAIKHHLGPHASRFHLQIRDHVPSSNSELLREARRDPALPKGSILAVEWQSAGRGRMGRRWLSGLGNALTFSLLWRFSTGLSSLAGLSLATGVAVIRSLHKLGIENVGLKWPNDVVTPNGKLAGMLIEAQGDMLGPCAVVIGIGLNLHLPPAGSQLIGQPAAALDSLTSHIPDRNHLLALLLAELGEILDQFAVAGFAGIRNEWERYHWLQNRSVQLSAPDGTLLQGLARGVTGNGALRLETSDGMQTFTAGEVSLRPMDRHAAD